MSVFKGKSGLVVLLSLFFTVVVFVFSFVVFSGSEWIAPVMFVIFDIILVVIVAGEKKESFEKTLSVSATTEDVKKISDILAVKLGITFDGEPDLKKIIDRIAVYVPAVSVQADDSKNGICSEITSSMLFYRESIDSLLKSIITNISSTTVPISKELLSIKDSIEKFIAEVSINEDEIRNQTDFKKLVATNNRMNDDFSAVYKSVTDSYRDIENRFIAINNIIQKIYENSLEIQSIAEKINVLSINAAIEAARSGEHGKGFKVISGEIKKLSDHTQNFVKEITMTVNESKMVVKESSESFLSEEKLIVNKINGQKEEFDAFYDLLSGYYNKFIDTYRTTIKLTDNVSGSITKINPVVQLHEITVQEIENLDLAVTDYFDQMIKKIADEGTIPMENDAGRIREMAYKIRERLTTSRELDALEEAIARLRLNGKIDLNRNNSSEIDFF